MSQLNSADQEDLLNRYMTLRYGLAAPAQTYCATAKVAADFFGGLRKGFCFVAGYRNCHTRRWQQSKHLQPVIAITIGAVNDVIALHDSGRKETHRLETVDCGLLKHMGSEKVLPEGLNWLKNL